MQAHGHGIKSRTQPPAHTGIISTVAAPSSSSTVLFGTGTRYVQQRQPILPLPLPPPLPPLIQLTPFHTPILSSSSSTTTPTTWEEQGAAGFIPPPLAVTALLGRVGPGGFGGTGPALKFEEVLQVGFDGVGREGGRAMCLYFVEDGMIAASRLYYEMMCFPRQGWVGGGSSVHARCAGTS